MSSPCKSTKPNTLHIIIFIIKRIYEYFRVFAQFSGKNYVKLSWVSSGGVRISDLRQNWLFNRVVGLSPKDSERRGWF